MGRRRWPWPCAVLVGVLAGLGWPQSPVLTETLAVRGRALMQSCAACHGPEGHSVGAIPALDRLAAADIVAALRAFRAETRQGTVMPRIAKGLDDADLAAIAAYRTAPPR